MSWIEYNLTNIYIYIYLPLLLSDFTFSGKEFQVLRRNG